MMKLSRTPSGGATKHSARRIKKQASLTEKRQADFARRGGTYDVRRLTLVVNSEAALKAGGHQRRNCRKPLGGAVAMKRGRDYYRRAARAVNARDTKLKTA